MPKGNTQNSQPQSERDRLIALIPEDAVRIQVEAPNGKTKWRDIGDIRPTDKIAVNPKTNGPFCMNSKPGRRKVASLPHVSPQAEAISTKRRHHMTRDGLLRAITENPNDVLVLDQVMVGLAEEAATIDFEKTEAERAGKEVSKLAVNRIKALRVIGDTWLNRKDKLQQQEIDLASNTFKLLFGFITETFRDAMKEAGMRDEQIDTVFNQVSRRMRNGWEAEARNRMKNG